MKVVALHGFGGGPATFDDVAARLATPLFAPLLPGHGDVDACSFDDAVARVAGCVDDDTVLWGYSLGARLALQVALRVPLRGLILESGRGSVDDAQERHARAALDDERADDLAARGVEAFFADWERGPLFSHLDETQRRRRRALRAHHDPRRLAAALRAFSPGRQQPFSVASLHLPVQLIAGSRDAVYVDHAEYLTRMLPACRVSIVSGAGHIPHVECPDAVAAVVNDFLAVLSPQATELRP